MINKNLSKVLENSIKNNKLQQVYLLFSRANQDIDLDILEFVRLVNDEKQISWHQCLQKEYCFIIDGSQGEISKENLQEFLNRVSKSSLFANKYKFLIIKCVENITLKAANSILKFLENPPFNTIILLHTIKPQNVLKTIKSRCFIIDIRDDFNAIVSVESFFITYKIDVSKQKQFRELADLIYNSPANLFNLILFYIQQLNIENYKNIILFSIFIFKQIYELKNSIKKDKNISKFDSISILNIINNLYNFVELIDNNNCIFNIQKARLILKLKEEYE